MKYLRLLPQKIRQWWHLRTWQYGTCITHNKTYGDHSRVARRNRFTGEVQFILWHKGESQCGYVYQEDFWCAYNSYWWPNFKPDPDHQGAENLTTKIA